MSCNGRYNLREFLGGFPMRALVILVGSIITLADFLPALSQPGSTATSLVLTCEGHVSFVLPNLDYDAEKHQYGDDKRVDTKGRLGLKLHDGAVTVRLPSGVPGGGAWRDADHVEVTPEEIRGRVLGARFTVDRHTGDIEMNGRPSFSGNCEKAADESGPTKF
jgi:hypothetical protein